MPTPAAAIPQYLPAPAPVRRVVAVLGAAAGLLGAAAAVLALRNSPAPLWAVVGLQLLVVPGGLFAVLWSRGRFAAGPVIALLCAAGAVGLPAMLSYIAHRGFLGPVAMKWWCFAELASAAGLTMLALVTALLRDAATAGPLAIRGLLFTAPAFAFSLAAVFGGRFGLDALLAKLPTAVRLGGIGAAGVFVAITLCIAAHYLSLAFAGAVQAGRRVEA